MSVLDAWIVHCADPLGPRSVPPRRPLPPSFAGELVEQAEAHGVLGALLQNFSGFKRDAAFAAGGETARSRNRANAAFSMLLAREADALMVDLEHVEATIVKGPVFARTLYPAPSLRCFSDIDILAAGASVPRVGEVLAAHGYYLAESHKREFKWLNRANDRIMVEVQTDLIHSENLHAAISLSYETIAASPASADTLLMIAIVHGAGHQYERLQHVVDICQAARALRPADEAGFEKLVGAANARFISIFGLLLAGRVLGEPRCYDIAQAIGSTLSHEIANVLVDRTVIMSTTDRRRATYNWRRLILRWLMHRGWRPRSGSATSNML